MIIFMTLAMMTFNDDDNDDDIQGSVSHLASLQLFRQRQTGGPSLAFFITNADSPYHLIMMMMRRRILLSVKKNKEVLGH